MRKVILAFLLGLSALIAHAQTVINVDKSILCSDLKTVIENISGNYVEVPFWNGKDSVSKYILMVNEKTKSWTFIQYNDKSACILGTGDQSNLIKFGKTVSYQNN